MSETTVPITYDPTVVAQHVRAMRVLLADTPYSGLLTVNTSAIETLADVERAYVDLRSVLRRAAVAAEAERSELAELRSQRRAMRDFLGTA